MSLSRLTTTNNPSLGQGRTGRNKLKTNITLKRLLATLILALFMWGGWKIINELGWLNTTWIVIGGVLLIALQIKTQKDEEHTPYGNKRGYLYEHFLESAWNPMNWGDVVDESSRNVQEWSPTVWVFRIIEMIVGLGLCCLGATIFAIPGVILRKIDAKAENRPGEDLGDDVAG